MMLKRRIEKLELVNGADDGGAVVIYDAEADPQGKQAAAAARESLHVAALLLIPSNKREAKK